MQIMLADDLVKFLEFCRVDTAFGVSGGFIVPVWQALSRSEKISLFHCRHESGAVFSASEYSLIHDRPAVAFATAGPGISNALTGLKAAKIDGSHLIFISAITAESKTGLWGLQETTRENIEQLVQVDGQGYFDSIYVISNESEYLAAKQEIAEQLTCVTGRCIGMFITTSAQKLFIESNLYYEQNFATQDPTNEKVLLQMNRMAEVIRDYRTLFWVGFSARHAAPELRKLAILTQSRVLLTPRGKGIFPESHPLYGGTTGLGSDAKAIATELDSQRHPVVIILGTRLGELSASRAQDALVDSKVYYIGLNNEDVANNLPPHTVFINCEIRVFLRSLLYKLTLNGISSEKTLTESSCISPVMSDQQDPHQLLHPQTVMCVLQDIVINRFDGFLAAEAGNTFVWTNRFLKFNRPGRYRTSPGLGAMGHYASGLIGLAANNSRFAMGIVGDGAMLMSSEISTAVRYNLPAIWLIMNDSCYNMCRQGLTMLENDELDCEIPTTDFALLGQALGATGYQVVDKSGLEKALVQAISARKPAVIDVRIDRNAVPPLNDRINTLKKL